MGPVAMLRPPPGASSQTQPDGRSVYSVFPSRLGQRGIAPFRARPLDEPRREVELVDGHVLHAVRLQQRLRVGAEHRPEGAGGRREAERAAGLGVHVRHRQRQVRRDQPVEPEAAALGQQLPDLDVVALAGALLVAAPRVAVEQPRLAPPLAEQRGDRALVGELGAVVGEHGAEHAARPVGAEDRPDALQGAATHPAVFSSSGSASCILLGRCSSVSRQALSSRAPSTVSISQAAAQTSSPRPRNAACDLRAECGAGVVEDVRAPLAADRAVPPAPVAAARPRGQARAGRRQVGVGVHALAAPLPRRRHEPVRRHLGAHRRGRPAQLPRDLPA